MVGSMTWFISPDDNREIMEAVQDHPTPIVSTPAMTSLILTPHHWVRRSISNDDLIASIDGVTYHLAECQLLVDLVLGQSRVSDEFPILQDHQDATTERPARPLCSRRPDSNLVIMTTPKGHTVQRRPLPTPTENIPKPYSFGLVGAGSIC